MPLLLLLLAASPAAHGGEGDPPPTGAPAQAAPVDAPSPSEPESAASEPEPAPPSATPAKLRRARREPRPPLDLEVGHTRRFGLGIALGWPPSATVKVFVDPRNAVALHLGTTLGTSGLHLRLQFEQTARRLKSWDWGELGIGWQVGVAVDFLFGQQASATAVRPGVLGGANVELRVAPAPVAVFGEVSPILYPFDLAARQETSFFPVGLVIVAGARWYF
jgi:hypothetical protein